LTKFNGGRSDRDEQATRELATGRKLIFINMTPARSEYV
jgi:hypothetical protein